MNNRFKRMRGNVLRKLAGLPLIVAVVTVFVIGSPQVAAAQAWSPWLDRDDPGGKGDYETVVDFKKAGQVCDNPIQIQCRFVGDKNPWPANPPTGYTCNTQLGGFCENKPGLECRDIEARFLCPKGLDEKKTGEAALHTPADRLTLSADPKVMSRSPKGCRLIARPWDSGDPTFKYLYDDVDFVLLGGPGQAPDRGQTDTKGVYEFSILAGQRIRAELVADPAVKSNDFKCDPNRTE